MEYDFVVAPHASPAPIRLHFAGADKLKLNKDGDLEVIAENGQIAFHKPVVYQQSGEKRQPVDGSFKLLAHNIIGFTLGSYDSNRPLVIDPVLAYSTYLGGSGGDYSTAIAADSAGNTYVVGYTDSTDFPVTGGAFQPSDNGNLNSTQGYVQDEVFISKISPSGTSLVYSSYLGGSGGDDAYCLAIDAAGDVYVAGSTYSTDFPVTGGAFQTTNKGGANGNSNGFVAELNSTGGGLVYSTYLGGSGLDGDYVNAVVSIAPATPTLAAKHHQPISLSQVVCFSLRTAPSPTRLRRGS